MRFVKLLVVTVTLLLVIGTLSRLMEMQAGPEAWRTTDLAAEERAVEVQLRMARAVPGSGALLRGLFERRMAVAEAAFGARALDRAIAESRLAARIAREGVDSLRLEAAARELEGDVRSLGFDDEAAAEACYRRALVLRWRDPTTPREELARTWYLLGQTYQYRNQPEQALPYFDRALAHWYAADRPAARFDVMLLGWMADFHAEERLDLVRAAASFQVAARLARELPEPDRAHAEVEYFEGRLASVQARMAGRVEAP